MIESSVRVQQLRLKVWRSGQCMWGIHVVRMFCMWNLSQSGIWAWSLCLSTIICVTTTIFTSNIISYFRWHFPRLRRARFGHGVLAFEGQAEDCLCDGLHKWPCHSVYQRLRDGGYINDLRWRHFGRLGVVCRCFHDGICLTGYVFMVVSLRNGLWFTIGGFTEGQVYVVSVSVMGER